jgi:hypothetical protein
LFDPHLSRFVGDAFAPKISLLTARPAGLKLTTRLGMSAVGRLNGGLHRITLTLKIDRLRTQAAEAQRRGDLGKVAEITYGAIPSLEKKADEQRLKAIRSKA